MNILLNNPWKRKEFQNLNALQKLCLLWLVEQARNAELMGCNDNNIAVSLLQFQNEMAVTTLVLRDFLEKFSVKPRQENGHLCFDMNQILGRLNS